MELNDLNKVWEIKTLRKIEEEEARKTLEKIAKQVQPIMRKRSWKVKLLSEFSPANPSLLGININRGAVIKLRLRAPKSDWNFIPYEQVLDTMLHELCHIVHGPHNSSFYALLDEIRAECEDLMAKGVTGSGKGFDTPGRRLGGFSRQPLPSSLRRVALDAAENRARRSAIMRAGPYRLGGDGKIKEALSPIQAAAMAAERRLKDDMWCGGDDCDVVPLGADGTGGGGDVAPEGTNGAGCGSVVVPMAVNEAGCSGDVVPVGVNEVESSSVEDSGWNCEVCTLLNKQLAPVCEACGSKKQIGRNSKEWACKFCTLQNSVGKDRCSACGEWRYSYGPPVGTFGPHLGT